MKYVREGARRGDGHAGNLKKRTAVVGFFAKE